MRRPTKDIFRKLSKSLKSWRKMVSGLLSQMLCSCSIRSSFVYGKKSELLGENSNSSWRLLFTRVFGKTRPHCASTISMSVLCGIVMSGSSEIWPPVRVLSRLQIGGGSIPAVSYGSENIVYCGHYIDRWTPSHSYPIISRLLELAHVELSPMGSTLLDEEIKLRKTQHGSFCFEEIHFFTARMSGMRWISRD